MATSAPAFKPAKSPQEIMAAILAQQKQAQLQSQALASDAATDYSAINMFERARKLRAQQNAIQRNPTAHLQLTSEQAQEQARILREGSAHEATRFARLFDSADIPALQARVLEVGTAEDAYYFARGVPGADIAACQARVLAVGDGVFAVQFATDIVGADIGALQQRVLAVGTGWDIRHYASDVVGADIAACQARVLEIGRAWDMYQFAKLVAGADVEALHARAREKGLDVDDFNDNHRAEFDALLAKHRAQHQEQADQPPQYGGIDFFARLAEKRAQRQQDQDQQAAGGPDKADPAGDAAGDDVASAAPVAPSQATQAATTQPPKKLSPREALRRAQLAQPTVDEDDPPPSYFSKAEDEPPSASPALPVETKKTPRELLRAAQMAASQRDGNDDDDGENQFFSSDKSPAPATAETQKISGVLNQLRVYNDWAVANLWTDGEEVRLTGSLLVDLTEGLEYTFTGTMKPSRHGDALEVTAYEPMISVDAIALERYLVKTFDGIGSIKAGKFIRKIQDDAIAARHDQPEKADLSDAQIRMEALAALREKLLHKPWEIDLSALMRKPPQEGEKDPNEAAKSVVIVRNLMLRLGGQVGFKESVAKALATYLLNEHAQKMADVQGQEAAAPGIGNLVEDTWAILLKNPYQPIATTPGYGFAMAEIVAKFAGIPKDSPMRLSALSEYAVDQECQRRGHVFLSPKEFVTAITKVDPSVKAQTALNHALVNGGLMVEVEKKRLYQPNLYQAEQSLAKNLAKLLQPAAPLTQRSEKAVREKLLRDAPKINPAFKDGLDPVQIDAVASIMVSPTRLHVLTGGPGTGKTSIVECAVSLLKNKTFLFAAPTGKAAKVLSARVQSTGNHASTLNSLLSGAVETGFMVNEEKPLTCDVLVIDESTMIGVEMADALLKALPPHAHVIFLGDPGRVAAEGQQARAGQLPSISPGRFMLDLLDLPDVNHVNLVKTQRNRGGILEVVNEVGDSALTVKDRDSVRFNDLPDPLVGFPAVMNEYLDRVMADGVTSTLLVMPKRKGSRDKPDWNTTYANSVLKSKLNPAGIKIPGSSMALGDRIIIRKNMTIEQPASDDRGRVGASLLMEGVQLPMGFSLDGLTKTFAPTAEATTFDEDLNSGGGGGGGEPPKERVVNGDTGTVIEYLMDPLNPKMAAPKWIRLALDDGREIDYPGAEMTYLDHAYALTIHSAQGSECKNVIMVATGGSADFMNQNMLFTGFSRAKETLSIHGDPRELVKIARTPMPPRNTALVERVIAMAEEMNPDREELPEEMVP